MSGSNSLNRLISLQNWIDAWMQKSSSGIRLCFSKQMRNRATTWSKKSRVIIIRSLGGQMRSSNFLSLDFTDIPFTLPPYPRLCPKRVSVVARAAALAIARVLL